MYTLAFVSDAEGSVYSLVVRGRLKSVVVQGYVSILSNKGKLDSPLPIVSLLRPVLSSVRSPLDVQLNPA